MPIVGTAGHVDHGKSLLITALTGTDPDRLPEEKQRGMTIDLGFAWFPDREGRPVGVIDVPGHERFIRNMVAGSWSLDCALLVVAADDGWMAQSETHLQVLSALSVPHIILVITKTDLASPERIHDVEADALSRCSAALKHNLPSVRVSALKKEGIEELRALILEQLDTLPERPEPNVPYLYIDRTFSLKGTGLITAGSLRGGPLHTGDELLLLPRGEKLRVRGLQSHNASETVALPGTRTALNLQGLKGPVERGDCLTLPGAPFAAASEFLAVLLENRGIRTNQEAEVSFGTVHRLGRIYLLGKTGTARIVLDAPGTLFFGLRFLLIRHGGSEIIGNGAALLFGPTRPDERRRFSRLDTSRLPTSGEVEFQLRGYTKEALERAPDGASTDKSVVRVGDWSFEEELLKDAESRLCSVIAKTGAASLPELRGGKELPDEALLAVLGRLAGRGAILAEGGKYLQPAEAKLSTEAEKLLSVLAQAGRAGYEPDKVSGPFQRKDFSYVCKLGHAVFLDGGIYYHADVYRELAAAVLAGRKTGETFSLQEAKEVTGLSRKYIIPFLNKLEQDKYVKRSNDLRIVVKPWGLQKFSSSFLDIFTLFHYKIEYEKKS